MRLVQVRNSQQRTLERLASKTAAHLWIGKYFLVSRDDLPVAELVQRDRGKQGQGSVFKGPLTELVLHHPPCKSPKAKQASY